MPFRKNTFARFKGPSKFRSMWFAPILLTGAFVFAALAVFGLIHASIHATKQKQLVDHAESTAESIRLRLDGNRDYLLLMAKERGAGLLEAQSFQERASRYIADHPELICINWVDADFRIVDVAPLAPNQQIVGLRLDLPEPKRASRLAMETRQPVYTHPFHVIQGELAFELWVPVYQDDIFRGVFGGIYSYERMLQTLVSPQVRERYHVSVADASGTVLLALPLQHTVDEKLDHRVSSPLHENGGQLQFKGYGPGIMEQSLWLLELLCLVFVMGIVYAMWRLKREIAASKQAKQDLVLLSFALNSVHEAAYLTDENARFKYVNDEACRVLGYSRKELLGLGVADIDPDFPAERWPGHWAEIKEKGALMFEGRHKAKDGHAVPVEIGANYFEYDGRGYNLALIRDITDRTRAEEARRTHIRFLENLGRVDQAIKQESDVEQMLRHVLETVFTIFDCDRAWLFYPCDPDSPTFRVPMEICRPEYPGAKILNRDVPMLPDMARNLREALASDDPVVYVAGTEKPINKTSAEQFGVQSQMFAALYPKVGKPWAFGMHQCSCPRVWTPEEMKLFQEIGRRLTDGLGTLLLFRNLQESETKYRSLIQKVQTAIVLHDSQGRILASNPMAQELLGRSESQLLGKTMADPEWHFLREDGSVMPVPEYPTSRVLATRQPLRGYVTGIRRPGRDDVAWVLVNAEPELTEAGETTRIIVSFVDITERRQAEKAFFEGQQVFRTLVENSPDIIARYDRDCRRTYVNPVYLKTAQISRQELLASSPAQRSPLPAVSAAILQKLLRKVLDHGKAEAVDVIWPKPDGICWYNIHAFPEFDREGQVVSVMTISRDITERKRAEETLHQLNRELRAISNCNQVLVRAEDEQTLLNDICRIVCKEAGYRLVWVGYAEQDAAKTLRPVAWAGPDSDYIANAKNTWADDTERGQSPAGKAIRSGEMICVQDIATDPQMAPWRKEALRHGYRSGIALPLKEVGAAAFGVLLIYSAEPNVLTPDEIRLLEELAGDLAFGVAALRSRAERKRTEQALENSEAKMRSILDNIGIGVSLISPQMEILELNRRMRQWFPAVDPAQHLLCYRAFNDPPRETLCDYCPTCKTLRDGLVHEATTQTPQAGGVRNYRVVSSPIFNPAGAVAAAIEMVEDITEQLSLEAQFRQAQKMESVGRLAGGVAHDFNNMLGVILGRAEMAMDRVDADHPIHADLVEIQKAAGRSADLTRQLLAFARKQTVVPRVLDLNHAMEGMLQMLQRLIGEDIAIVWRPGLDLWPIRIDPSQIDQILANLCVNARDAIAGTGTLTIATENNSVSGAAGAETSERAPGDYVRLAVSDTGCGMDKETLANLFEPFFTTKGIGKGTGLGLATVYGIVKQNRGFIQVESEPGRGTTFWIYLPRQMGRDGPVTTETPAAPAVRGGETILLVEDEPAILNMTAAMLHRLGYTVLSAATPSEALHVAQAHPVGIHLLMTDVVMPEMNGRDLAKDLLVLYPNLKRLFMSGYTADVITYQGVMAEGVNFIQKPFTMPELSNKIREVLVGK